MPALKTYDLFISHAWRYNSDYYNLETMLSNASNFNFRNYSVPEHDPVINPDSDAGKRTLMSALDGQIRPVNIVLVIAGMYASHSYWIQSEINIAQRYGKPILCVRPWGQERISQAVQDAAVEIVYWNTDSIVDAIRRRAL